MRLHGIQVAILLSATALPLRAQTPQAALGSGTGPEDSLVDTVAVDPRYAHGRLHDALLGEDYRALWSTPLQAPVLDLQHYAGGLRPVREGGGTQTTSLHLESADGRKFDFRSVDKTATRVLPPDLRRTIVGRTWQDQVSAYYPAAALVSTSLLQAVGVRTAPLQLFVMPDDPALGAFRQRFAGMIGTLEERPAPKSGEEPAAFEGTRKVVTTDQLYDRLTRDPRERADSREFLAARLMDVFLGDNDRGEPQWQWLKEDAGKSAPWEPLPVDRDHDFARFNGLLVAIASIRDPVLVKFGPRYPSAVRLNWRARFIDRRLLDELDWTTWDSVAHALQTRLTDSVIDDAVRRLPPSYYAEDGVWLAAALRSRRDRLPEAAHALYRLVALDAEVYGTDAGEMIAVTRGPGRTLDVAIRARAGGLGDGAYFQRRFSSASTKEVRLFLEGGADSVLIRGAGNGPKLRIIAGADPKVVAADAAGAWTRVYASYPGVTIVGEHPPSLDHRPYRQPDSISVVPPAPRDWGHQWRPWAGLVSGDGLALGVGATLFDYGFRRNPYAARFDVRTGYSTEVGAFAGELVGDVWRENSGAHLLLGARASGFDILRFFGFGNATPRTASADFYQAYQDDYQLSVNAGWVIGEHLTARVGPELRYSNTDFGRATLISTVRPYGSGSFGELGAAGSLTYDTRDTAAAPTRGLHLHAGAGLYPAVWDVKSAYGTVEGSAATYLSAPLPLRPTLAVRVGGQRVWGAYPFQDAATIGGGSTVRGLYLDRYMGDASAYANAELRLRVSRYRLFVPGEIGIFGLSDAGRVWLAGESSDRWRTSLGGGLWLAPLDRRNTVSVAVARGDGRTALYVQTGFMF